ncbi:MAG: zinc-ribbon domain containing protein [Dehalococcoidia bacterium]
MSGADRTLVCRDCGRVFTFTAGEQEFYASKGLTNDPVRCQSCRASRKSTQSNSSSFEVEDTGYVRYGTFASYGGRTPRQMHPATCADCGQMTEVPFVPRGDRPVYCSACYNKIRAPRV